MKNFKNRKTLLFIIILLIIGFIGGLAFIFYISDMDKVIVTKEIEEYIALINANKYNYFEGFINSAKINFLYITLIWSVGILFIFFPIIYGIIVYKGFIAGFLISSFVMIYGLKGIVYSIIFMFPQVFINVFLIVSLSIISIKFSKKIYNKIKLNESFNLIEVLKKYMITYLIFIGLSVVCSILEVFLNTFLIKLVI